MTLVMSALYGLCMGSYAAIQGKSDAWRQLLASFVKVPLLFFLTLIVTFPSLYVFNALVGSRLAPAVVGRLLVAALGVMTAVLASLGPITVFFSISTTSYPFMIVFNVVVFAVSGILGLSFLLQTLHRMSLRPGERQAADAVEGENLLDAGPLSRAGGTAISPQVRLVFRIWVVVFGLVGAQMGWVVRPFVGNPHMPFTWFRPRQLNFFMGVLENLRHLLSS